MIPRLIAVVVAICGTASAQTAAPAPAGSFNLQTTIFTIPTTEAARLGLAWDPAEPNVGSVISPEELQKLAAKLRETKGFEMFNAPEHNCSEREPVVVEQVREFQHSTAFEGPAPTDKKPVESSALLPRLRPTKFATRNVGMTVRMIPSFSREGLIDLQVDTKLVSLAGWAGYHQGKTAISDDKGFPAEGFQMPVFSTTHCSSSLMLKSHHTALIGGFPVLEHVPLKRESVPTPQVEKLRFIAITAVSNGSPAKP